MGLGNNVTCLNGHHRPQHTWWPSAPKYGQFKIKDDVGAPCPHPRLCKKSVKQEAWIKSKPWTNYFHFTGGAWRGSFFRTPRELKCHNFHQNTLFESRNSKWWWRFTVCCSRQVRWAPPLRSLTCARAACCSSFEGLRWDVSCRGYAWGLILGSRYVL